ncbi:GspE/PulE family protein [Patescibacteria group bacterium]|nr:GspE/PulE family protein [Patescibacteria group bacterium]
MNIPDKKLEEILVKPGHVDVKDFENAKERAKNEKTSLYKALINGGCITDNQLGQLIAIEFGFKFADLKREGVDKDYSDILPELVAKTQHVIVFGKGKKGLKVAMDDPSRLDLISMIEKKTGEPVVSYYATTRDIEFALDVYRKELKEQYDELLKLSIAEAEGADAEEAPIVKIVDVLFEYAYKNQASDVHIEPRKEKTIVRFRIDGMMVHVLDLPSEIHESVVTRIKILANLRTDEHFSPQDGKIVRQINDDEIDIRVSIVPITTGEKVVMRLLAERTRTYALESLGMQESDFEKIRQAIKKPWGMILASGPTGCGKTTTLYSILKVLNRPEVNIATIEDPVEYDLEDVNQIQVNPNTDLTFAKGLKSIVRQDPDIIMVGEIRDQETAGIAVNSAMTGHLVLSTIHTNDASTAFPRLLDMDIEPFLIASTVNVIIAQRLVRKICQRCRASVELSAVEKEQFRKQLSTRVKNQFKSYLGGKKIVAYKGAGCSACNNTGYIGRVGIFEVLDVDDDLKPFIMKRANANEIEKEAIKKGMTTMIEDGITKIIEGVTTIEEVIRVIRE